MDVVDVISTIIKQNPKTWAWNYNEIVPLPDKNGLFFRVEAKLQGFVMILHNPFTNLFHISFFDNDKNKILEKEGVAIERIIHEIHQEVFIIKDSTEILMYCNSAN